MASRFGVHTNFSFGSPDKKNSRLRRQRKLRALLLSKYDSVWSQTEALGWSPMDSENEQANTYNVCWSDTSVALERIMRMGRLQKINHFPGMLELVRKTGTARNLNKTLRAVGKDYKFFPTTYMLPADYTELKKEFNGKNHGNKTFIVKPSKGCQGTGIRLTRKLDEISPHEPNIVQRYMHRPHLLEGYKYDLRLYVLLSSVAPMRIFLFREGLVRICTEKYAPLACSRFIHGQMFSSMQTSLSTHATASYSVSRNASSLRAVHAPSPRQVCTWSLRGHGRETSMSRRMKKRSSLTVRPTYLR